MGKRFVRVVALALTILGSLFLPALGGVAQADVTSTTLISASPLGAPGDADSSESFMTPDGRYVAFHSGASNLTSSQISSAQTYVYDRTGNVMELVSQTESGEIGDGSTEPVGISSDGRYVLLNSMSTNFPGGAGLFLKDTQQGTLSRISDYSNTPPVPHSMSDDGNTIAFTKNDGINPVSAIIINRNAGTSIELPSATVLSLSGDGKLLAYTDPYQQKYYLYDIASGQSTPILSDFATSNEPFVVILNGDGSKALFDNPLDETGDGVYEYDFALQKATLVDRCGGFCGYPEMSADSRYVVHEAGDIDPVTHINWKDVWVVDTQTDVKTLVAHSRVRTDWLSISADGSLVAYNIAPASRTTSQVYVSELTQAQLDSTPPTVSGSPNDSTWYNHDVAIHWTATDDSGSATQPADTVASLEGTNTYTSGQSCDPSGNCATGSVTLSIDKTAPVINSDTWTANPLTQGQSTTLSANVTEANPATVTYSVDGGAALPMMVNFASGTWDATFGSSLAVGSHAITITATDLAGNTASKSDTLTVVNTGTGSNVNVTPVSGVTLTFGNVTTAGNTTATPATPPSVTGTFKFGNPPTYYDISTTAVFSGNVTVCMSYDPATVNGQGNNLSLWHYHNGVWSEITTSVDLTNHVICGVTTDFSGFGIASKPDFQGLVNTISAMNIKQGILNSLDVKYSDANAALNEAAAGDYSDVVGSLNAALNEISAQSGKALTTDQANTLTAMTNELLSYFR